MTLTKESLINQIQQGQVASAPSIPSSASVIPPTEKQIKYFNVLVDQKIAPDGREFYRNAMRQESWTKSKLSEVIKALVEGANYVPAGHPVDPVKEVSRALQSEPELGFYQYGGVIYQVKKSKNLRHYAKALIQDGEGEDARFHWEYVGRNPFRHLNAENRLTLEQAKQFGKIYGICCICNATLSDPKSVEVGIGPICLKKFQ